MPRPTTYNRRIADRIIDAVAGGASMRAACRAVGVPWPTCQRWQRDNRDGFHDRVKEAYETKILGWVDELDELAAQELGSDSMAAVQARRTQIDVRKWIASKVLPHLFGDRVSHQFNIEGTVELYLPDKRRLPGDDVRLVEGEAQLVEDEQ